MIPKQQKRVTGHSKRLQQSVTRPAPTGVRSLRTRGVGFRKVSTPSTRILVFGFVFGQAVIAG